MSSELSRLLESVLEESFETIESSKNFRESDFWDSLKYVNLVVSLESTYKIKLTKDDVQKLLSVSGIQEVLKNHGVLT